MSELLAQLGAITTRRVPPRQLPSLFTNAKAELRSQFDSLPDVDKNEVMDLAEELSNRSVRLLTVGDERYPHVLSDLRSPPPFLFAWGNLDLLDEPGVGMCGSRDASARGLECARLFGRTVAASGFHVISGYARGVDTETHIGALEVGGGTVIVLAEGILHFRKKKVFSSVPFNEDRVLVLSQFAPASPWSAGRAMTRNGLIVALGNALIVIEAGERGGTLNAGLEGLRLGRPVFAIGFSEDPPAGNELLISKGAKPVRTKRELVSVISSLTSAGGDQQLSLERSPEPSA